MKDWKDGGEEWSKPWGNSAAQSHDRVHVGRATRRREQARSAARYVAATRNRRKIQGKIDKEESEKLVRYQRAAVLTLPSVLVPLEKTFLLNPKHRDFDKITIKDMSVFILDPRLR